jgi:hypothetical protein
MPKDGSIKLSSSAGIKSETPAAPCHTNSESNERKPGKERDRGVTRIPLSITTISETDINELIVDNILLLAQNGKRLRGVPKRL